MNLMLIQYTGVSMVSHSCGTLPRLIRIGSELHTLEIELRNFLLDLSNKRATESNSHYIKFISLKKVFIKCPTAMRTPGKPCKSDTNGDHHRLHTCFQITCSRSTCPLIIGSMSSVGTNFSPLDHFRSFLPKAHSGCFNDQAIRRLYNDRTSISNSTLWSLSSRVIIIIIIDDLSIFNDTHPTIRKRPHAQCKQVATLSLPCSLMSTGTGSRHSKLGKVQQTWPTNLHSNWSVQSIEVHQ